MYLVYYAQTAPTLCIIAIRIQRKHLRYAFPFHVADFYYIKHIGFCYFTRLSLYTFFKNRSQNTF